LRLRRILATLAAMKTDVIDPEVALPSVPAVPDPNTPIPRQIRYIIGNEGCERFSFFWDTQHPDGVSGHVAAHIFAGGGSGERCEGGFPHVRHRRLFFSIARRVDRGPVLLEIPH
jgi:hypothetical protein